MWRAISIAKRSFLKLDRRATRCADNMLTFTSRKAKRKATQEQKCWAWHIFERYIVRRSHYGGESLSVYLCW